ncbi:MAG: imidazolonepropionase [Salinibacter sp.]
MPVLTNVAALVTPPPPSAEADATDLRRIEDAALAWTDDTIEWVGPAPDLPSEFEEDPIHDAEGALVIPGLVDCHTHLAFAGWRADEFAVRLGGRSYQDIAKEGGGILDTVRKTRAAAEEELYDRSRSFLREMAHLGVTTVEAKSGYGLTAEDELKQLRVYRRLRENHPLRIVPTFLGAHTVPPEYEADREGYLELLHVELLPRVGQQNLAEFCDAFVEDGVFQPEEARRLFQTARQHGLRPKLHADQLSDTGGAALAAEVGAASADHLEHISPEGIAAMADAGVVAVSLPLATLYLDEDPLPVAAFREADVPLAVATDFNPGTAPSYHLPFALTLACTLQRMTPAEALAGATRHAAAALNRDDEIGSLAPGMQADFALIDAPNLNQWLYHVRPNAAVATYVQGRRWTKQSA